MRRRGRRFGGRHPPAAPRIDPRSLPEVVGVEVEAFRPDLHRRLAAADFAIVQGGLSTTMELVAAGRPFVYVPLRNHFEQDHHVRLRLDNYGANIVRTVDYRPVEPGGADRVARLLADPF